MTCKKIIICLIISLFPGVNLLAQDTDDAVKDIAAKFVKSADDQNPDLLASVLFPDAKQFVLFGPQVLQSNAAEYVAQIRAKKLGGKPRKVSYEDVIMEGEDTAFIKLKAVGGGLAFAYHLTMFKLEGSWKIMTITTKASREI